MAGSRRIRTDLALETTERFAQENTEIRGVEIQEDYDEEKDIRTTVVKIVTENGAKSMGRPQGNYITIEAPDLSNADEDYHREISQEISRHLRELIDLEKERSILGSGTWKCGDHSRCTGTACDREPSYDTASHKGVWDFAGSGRKKYTASAGSCRVLWRRQGWRQRRSCRALSQRQSRMWWLQSMHLQRGACGG